MKKRIYVISLIFFLVLGCAQPHPVKEPQYTESNLPKAKKIHYVPYFRPGYAQCFPACLYMIFKFYGEESSYQEIDDWIRGAKGTSAQTAEQFCIIKKFNTLIFYDGKGDKIKYFLAQGYPLIAWVDIKGFGHGHHVIVLTGYNDEKQVFYINDPGNKDKEISYKNFKEIRSLVEGVGRYYTLLIWPSSPNKKLPYLSTSDHSTLTVPPGVEAILKPQWVVGDTWVCQKEKGKIRLEVAKVDSSRKVLKIGETRGYFDNDLGWIKSALGERLILENNPPNKGALFFPLWVGKKWRNEFSQKNIGKGTIYNFVELFQVKGWEDIQTPAGVFEALRIEIFQENLDARESRTYTLWYSPKIKYYVKSASNDLKENNWILADFIIK